MGRRSAVVREQTCEHGKHAKTRAKQGEGQPESRQERESERRHNGARAHLSWLSLLPRRLNMLLAAF